MCQHFYKDLYAQVMIILILFDTLQLQLMQHAIFCHKILCFQIETQFSMIVKEIRHFLQIKFNPIPGGAGGASDAKVKCL